MSEGKLIQPSIFPGYIGKSGQFLLGKTPSGRAGAKVKLTLTLNNAPQIVYGVRLTVSYELPLDFFAANPGFKRDMREGGVDDDFDVQITLTQQNITQDTVHVRAVQGADGRNWHPFPAPYLFQGGNNVVIVAERKTSYPDVTTGEDPVVTVVITPTLSGALVLNEFVGGRQPTPIRAAP